MIDPTFDQAKKIISKDLDNWNSNFWRLRCREQFKHLFKAMFLKKFLEPFVLSVPWYFSLAHLPTKSRLKYLSYRQNKNFHEFLQSLGNQRRRNGFLPGQPSRIECNLNPGLIKRKSLRSDLGLAGLPCSVVPVIKFIYPEKAKKFCEDLTGTKQDKSTVEISQNFMAFSEYMILKV